MCPERGGDQTHKGVGLRKDADTWKCTCCQYRVKDSQLRSSLVAARKKLMTVIQVPRFFRDDLPQKSTYLKSILYKWEGGSVLACYFVGNCQFIF